MCAEAVPWRCHRSLIADALTVRGIRVRDIISYQRKGGSTIPVKFTVCDAFGNPISNPAAVFAGTGGSLTMLSAVRGTVTNINETC